MSDISVLPLRFGRPLFRLNWCLLALWLALGALGRAPADALYFCAIALHVLVTMLEPLLEIAREPFVRWPALVLAAAVLVASTAVSGNAIRVAAERDQQPVYLDRSDVGPDYDSGGGACDPEAPEV